MRLSLLFTPCLLVLTNAAFAQATLWYNGDIPLNSGGFQNQQGGISDQLVFADFRVTDPGGWVIKQIWSNNASEAPPHDTNTIGQAAWSIRTGMTALPPGSGGVTLFSGVDFAQNTLTGRIGDGQPEYELRVTGLNLFLPQGVYWLQVTPVVTNGGGGTRTSATNGANAIGRTDVNDGESIARVSGGYGGVSADLSMGVSGFVESTVSDTPEPGSIALLVTSGLTGAAFLRRKRTRK